MIAEPYICTKGSDTGQIHWYTQVPAYGWIPYANFERRKLKELDNVKTAYCGFQGITISCKDCYWVLLSRKDCADNKCTFPWQTIKGDRAGEKQHCHHYGSADLIGYKPSDYDKDSESSRLLKRAEFLKAVCEKEGVEWLPITCSGNCCKSEEPKSKCKHKWIGCQQGWTTSLWCSECGAEPKELENRTTTSASTYKDTHEMSTMYLHSNERDYYTKEEEKEFRRDLLDALQYKTYYLDGSGIAETLVDSVKIDSLRKKYL